MIAVLSFIILFFNSYRRTTRRRLDEHLLDGHALSPSEWQQRHGVEAGGVGRRSDTGTLGSVDLLVVVLIESPAVDVDAHVAALKRGSLVSQRIFLAFAGGVPTEHMEAVARRFPQATAWHAKAGKSRGTTIREALGLALSAASSVTHVMLSSASHTPDSKAFMDSLVLEVIDNQWSAGSCTTVRPMSKGNSTMLAVDDAGFIGTDGLLGADSVAFASRQFSGMSASHQRLRQSQTADFPSPHCLVMSRGLATVLLSKMQWFEVPVPERSGNLSEWVLEASTRLHWLGRSLSEYPAKRGPPTPENGALLNQLDNFRRHVIPRLRDLAGQFLKDDKLVARLDVERWQPPVVDNMTEDVHGVFMDKYVRPLAALYRLIDAHAHVDQGVFAGDLLLIYLGGEIRALGGQVRVVPAFARINRTFQANSRELEDRGYHAYAASVALSGPPLMPELPMTLRDGSFHGNSVTDTQTTVVWDTVCCGCCGFASEIVHFIHPLRQKRRVRLTVDRNCFCAGYDPFVADNMDRMNMAPATLPLAVPMSDILIWISHSGPWSYYNHELVLRRPDYFVGRSMYEFTKIPPEWATQIRPINEVWVPGQWVKDVFIANGVEPGKIVVIPEGIDVEYYDPAVRGTIDLPLTGAQEGWQRFCNRPGSSRNFKFFSNFKWEPRKGWDILFRAYFGEFQRDEPVSLYVLSNVLGTNLANSSEIEAQFSNWVHDAGFNGNLTTLPHFCIITELVPEGQIGDLYNSADAFVLPTRGEGWGLPTIQAMALGKPTVSTAWGGQMEFMTRETSFMIELDGLEELPEDSQYGHVHGKKWATPSVRHTSELMRYVWREREHAAAVGRRAREHIVAHFSEEAVAAQADKRLGEIQAWIKHLRAISHGKS